MSNANETGKNVADTMDVSITVDDEKVKTTDVEIELTSATKTEDTNTSVQKKNNEKVGTTKVKKLKHKRKIEVSLLELFDTLDFNDSGYLSNNEIIVGLHMLGVNCQPKKVISALKKVHSANLERGTMDCDQFLSFMQLIAETHDLELLNTLIEVLNSGRITSLSINTKLTDHKVAVEKRVANSKAIQASAVVLEKPLSYMERQNKKHTASLADENFHDVKSTRRKIWEFFMMGKNFYFTVVIGWILMGTLIYCVTNGWDFGRSFYYSVQAGLSIGFGSLSEDKLTGTDLWGGCTTNVTELISMLHEQYPSGILPNTDAGEICASYAEKNSLADISKLYSVVHLMLGASIISGVLSLFATMAVESSSVWYDELSDEIKEGLEDVKKQYAVGSDSRVEIEAVISCYSKLSLAYRRNRSMWNSVVLLFLWLTVGVVYGVVKEKWSFITSLYYASAACSTGGLQGPTPDDTGVWFSAIYCIIGVPIYGYTLGQFANGLSESYLKRMKKDTLASAITAAEFSVVSTLRGHGNHSHGAKAHGGIDLFDFTLMELYRLRKTDDEEIQEIFQNFEALDADQNGIFTRSEMQAALAFAKHDKDNSTTLSLSEMKILIHELQHERSFEYEGLTMLPKDNEYTTHEIKLKMKQFNDPDDDKIVLDRTEFMKFWSKEFEDQIKNAPLGGTMMELHHLMDILKEEGNPEM